MVKDIVIKQGKTFTQLVRWETAPIVYKAITAITNTAPVRITSTAHTLVTGWRAAVVSVKGMTQINAESVPPKDKDFKAVTVIDPNTIEINEINAADFKPYTSGGYLQFNTPVDLTGYTARMQIKNRVGGTVLASSLAGDAPNNTIVTSVDNNAKTITVTISALNTAAYAFDKGVYELELVSSGGVVDSVMSGAVVVSKEVTTNG